MGKKINLTWSPRSSSLDSSSLLLLGGRSPGERCVLWVPPTAPPSSPLPLSSSSSSGLSVCIPFLRFEEKIGAHKRSKVATLLHLYMESHPLQYFPASLSNLLLSSFFAPVHGPPPDWGNALHDPCAVCAALRGMDHKELMLASGKRLRQPTFRHDCGASLHEIRNNLTLEEHVSNWAWDSSTWANVACQHGNETGQGAL